MRRRRASSGSSKPLGPGLATAGLAVLLVADVVLAVFALRPPVRSSEAMAAASTHASALTPAPSALATTTGTQAYSPAPLTRMVAALDGERAWRATTGTCADGGAQVQVTTDGGRTWSAGRSPDRAIARIQPLRSGRGFVYAAGRDCSLRELSTTDAARSWSRPTPVKGAWARLTSDSHVVVTPGAATGRPCGDVDVADLARQSASEASALCVNGTIVRTLDGGRTWTDIGVVPGALTLASREEHGAAATYVAGPTPDCAGIAIAKVAVATGSTPTSVACLPSTGPAAAGTVSLSVVEAAGWLAVGDQIWVSGADLTTWKRTV